MKASKLVELLKKRIEEHGDQSIYLRNPSNIWSPVKYAEMLDKKEDDVKGLGLS